MRLEEKLGVILYEAEVQNQLEFSQYCFAAIVLFLPCLSLQYDIYFVCIIREILFDCLPMHTTP